MNGSVVRDGRADVHCQQSTNVDKAHIEKRVQQHLDLSKFQGTEGNLV